MDNNKEEEKCKECDHDICPMCHLGCHNIDCGSFVDPIRAGKANCFELLRPSPQSPVSEELGLTNGGKPHKCFEIAIHNTRSKDMIALCPKCKMPVDMELLSGNKE